MITKTLKVEIWGKEIGRLSWDSRRGLAYFEYNPEFLEGNLDAFPLTASIYSPASRRPYMGDKERKIYSSLPPFIADSLPDAWGNSVFECWRIERGLSLSDITPIDILSFIGKRGMGALEYIPETPGIKRSEKIDLMSLTDLAHRIFRERESVKISGGEALTMQSLISVGTSAGGRQPKAIIAMNDKTGEIRSGQIAGRSGFKYYILKFGDRTRSSAELEMSYYEMALAAKIDMMPSRLIEVSGEKHFITERFDRHGDKKLHIQTLAAMYPEADSYEKLIYVCNKLRLQAGSRTEIFRRMVFNILANNTDDHNKNFSFIMNEEGIWSLAPAYDMTYIFNSGGFLPEVNQCMMIRGKIRGVTIEDAKQFAKDCEISSPDKIITEVAQAISQFRQYATKYGVKENWIAAIENTINKRLGDWGLRMEENEHSLDIAGHAIHNVRVEQSYGGNFHLYATIDGRYSKFVIRPKMEEYAQISTNGVHNLSADFIEKIVKKYLLKG